MNHKVQKTKLALLGGEKAVQLPDEDMFTWPIVTREHEEAVLEVIRNRNMSGVDITKKFEQEYAKRLGVKYALGFNNGTSAIQTALYGMGVGIGDEIIAPSLTYWASCLQVFSLGATVRFADVCPDTLCIDPEDIERRITKKTKAIVVVHYLASPADMDRIMAIADRHGIMVFEDISHAHGARYKGKEVGTFGLASAASLMSGKSFAIGEAGMLFTNDQKVYERAVLFGHYERHNDIQSKELQEFSGLPHGGYKYRMHQASSAFGLVQLKLYDRQIAEIDKAMNYYCDLLENVPALYPIRPEPNSGTTKGGWYIPAAKYRSEELGGLSLKRFTDALCAEGSLCFPGVNKPLHMHPVFASADIYGHGVPTRVANMSEQDRSDFKPESLPVTERINNEVLMTPWFKHYRSEYIEQHVNAVKKVIENYHELLPGDTKEEIKGELSGAKARKVAQL